MKKELIDQLKENLNSLKQYNERELIRRSDWGEIHFESVKTFIELALSIANNLLRLPLEHLPDQTLQEITGHIPSVVELFKKIDEFSLEGTPKPESESICSELIEKTETLHYSSFSSIPYLLYKHGDIEEDSNRLNQMIGDFKVKLKDTDTFCTGKKEEIQEIVEVTRAAAATTGVAIFTQEFHEESLSLEKRSTKWLWATALAAVVTLCVAIYFICTKDIDSANLNISYIIGKVTVIAILFTCSLWCGRIYRALIHQSTINKHRALSLKTFQAFVKATDDPYIKDAVLMAATKAIFSNVSTGFVGQPHDHDSGVNFVEFGKSGENVANVATNVTKT